MKETKTASASPEARAAMHEMMAAFEAFKGANDARLDEIEKKASADVLLEGFWWLSLKEWRMLTVGRCRRRRWGAPESAP